MIAHSHQLFGGDRAWGRCGVNNATHLIFGDQPSFDHNLVQHHDMAAEGIAQRAQIVVLHSRILPQKPNRIMIAPPVQQVRKSGNPKAAA